MLCAEGTVFYPTVALGHGAGMGTPDNLGAVPRCSSAVNGIATEDSSLDRRVSFLTHHNTP